MAVLLALLLTGKPRSRLDPTFADAQRQQFLVRPHLLSGAARTNARSARHR